MGLLFKLKPNVWVAAADGNISRVKELVLYGTKELTSRDSYGYTPLHAAVSYSHDEICKFLLEQGADVNAKDVDGDTPLHLCEDVGCAKLLIDFGADMHAMNNRSKSPVDVIMEEQEDDLIEFIKNQVKERHGGRARSVQWEGSYM